MNIFHLVRFFIIFICHICLLQSVGLNLIHPGLYFYFLLHFLYRSISTLRKLKRILIYDSMCGESIICCNILSVELSRFKMFNIRSGHFMPLRFWITESIWFVSLYSEFSFYTSDRNILGVFLFFKLNVWKFLCIGLKFVSKDQEFPLWFYVHLTVCSLRCWSWVIYVLLVDMFCLTNWNIIWFCAVW